MIEIVRQKKIFNIFKTINYGLQCAAVICSVFLISAAFTQLANAQKVSSDSDSNFGGGGIYTVSNLNDSGAGSLRQAIIDNNNNPNSTNRIEFSVAGTISPISPLPVITGGVTIDGYTAPGAVLSTGGVSSAFSGTLTIELDGTNAGTSGIGLQISAPSLVRGLVINRFQSAGIRVNTGANSSSILGNFIGTNTAGNAALGNFNRGILIVGATGVIIGGTPNANRNVISGNSGTGISITGGGSAAIRKNFIGVAADGTTRLGNTQEGIRIVDSSGTQVGTASASRNIISGNNGSGVSIIQSSNVTSAANNSIVGNYIGVGISGNTAVPNSGSGVLINAATNTVGGITNGDRNVISGNSSNGISISTIFATGNIIAGNYIGVGDNGTTALANRDNGIQIAGLAAGNIIGGTGITAGACDNACNIIANNGDALATSSRAGIYIDTTAGVSNAIRGNSIFNNTGIGIDLGGIGATANDADDVDTGPNDLQNNPVLSSANTSNSVTGTLDSTPNTSFVLDFFLNSTADGINSEGRTFIGSMNVITDANGDALFTFSSSVTFPAGQFVTATATSTGTASSFAPQNVGDSSEFSNPAQIVAPTAAAVEVSGRVLSGNFSGISNALVTLTDSNGNTLGTRTNSFGYYKFVEVNAGETYTVKVSHKRYRFAPQILSVDNTVWNFDLYSEQ